MTKQTMTASIDALIDNTKFAKIAHLAKGFAYEILTVADTLKLSISAEQVLMILRYLDGLLLWAKAYNLTAITYPHDALVKHIFDCMAIIPDLPFRDESDKRVLDIGTGAGLPSVLIAILRPDWPVDALDSNSKKIRFIRQIASEIKLTNITPIASRIEAHQADYALYYDVITSRAFASLSDFVELAEPCLADGGVLYTMKGKLPTDDEMMGLDAWQISIKTISVPKLSDDRCVVYLQK